MHSLLLLVLVMGGVQAFAFHYSIMLPETMKIMLHSLAFMMCAKM